MCPSTYAKIRFRSGLCPRPCWGSSRHSPNPVVGWRGDTFPHIPLHSAQAHLKLSPCVPQNSSQINACEAMSTKLASRQSHKDFRLGMLISTEYDAVEVIRYVNVKRFQTAEGSGRDATYRVNYWRSENVITVLQARSQRWVAPVGQTSKRQGPLLRSTFYFC